MDVCEAAGIRLGIVLQYRLRPVVLRLRTLIEQGELGELAMVQLSIPWWRPQSYTTRQAAARWPVMAAGC